MQSSGLDLKFNVKPAWKVDTRTAIEVFGHEKFRLKGPSTRCEGNGVSEKLNTRSLAVKGHDIQGSPVKILTKIRVTLALNGLRFWGLRVTFKNIS